MLPNTPQALHPVRNMKHPPKTAVQTGATSHIRYWDAGERGSPFVWQSNPTIPTSASDSVSPSNKPALALGNQFLLESGVDVIAL